MDFNFTEKLKEIKHIYKINTTDNALLSMILVELVKLNENIEKLQNKSCNCSTVVKEKEVVQEKKTETKK